MSAPAHGAPFAARTVAILVAVVAVAFASFALLLAYGGELRPMRGNAGTNALSNSAVGFAGAAELARITGGEVFTVRDEAGLDGESLLVLTPGFETPPDRVRAILARREHLPTLIVLPKWAVRPLPSKPGWVEAFRALPGAMAMAPLGDAVQGTVAGGRGALRTIGGPNLNTLIEAPGGGALLAGIDDTAQMILADPDALNNRALKTREGVARALAILDHGRGKRAEVAFDLTLHGFGRSPNLLRLAFEPPFLPLTICLLLAAALAVLHALRRFGPVAHEERALGFGKRAIAENAAALLRLARRRHRTGGRYAMLTRDAVAQGTGAPAGLGGEALDRYLDRLDPDGEPFTSIAARAENAPDTRRLLAAARDLYQWRRTVTREHR